MSWADDNGLAKRIKTTPLIICGPILRRVEPNSVSVFIAFRRPREVKLRIYEGDTVATTLKLESDTVQTIPLGEYLHVTAVTAKLRAPLTDLKPGIVYGYDLAFTQKTPLDPDDFVESFPGQTLTLGDTDLLTGKHSLGYQDNQLPTFSLPPDNLNDLRIIHGSCRRPHAEGLDALEALDMMIKSSITKPNNRPHQLFLTGDQIYVDSVDDGLLMALTDAGDTLLGWSEILPGVDASRKKELEPGFRHDLAKEVAGFTSGYNMKSHLFGLGEFYAMYLFAWSPALWPAHFPKYTDLYIDKPKTLGSVKTKLANRYDTESKRRDNFYSKLPNVRRALANIPTYMIFDDHEITDDWYISWLWCRQVLSKTLGRRVIQNGLLAYAVFQAWGNTPERFALANPQGGDLLKAAEQWKGGIGFEDGVHEKAISDRLLPKFDAKNKPISVKSDMDRMSRHKHALDWHYTVTGPRHEVLVLDTRTWRGYPGAAVDPPALLSPEGFQIQIGNQPNAGKDVTIVIVPSPVLGVPVVEDIQVKAAIAYKKSYDWDAEPWAGQEIAFESLLAILALRGRDINVAGKQTKRSRIIFLSGDVHHGFAIRMQYGATKPYRFSGIGTHEVEMVAAQLTSSALKNQERKTRVLHNVGYVTMDRLPRTKGGVGWNNTGGHKKKIGTVRNTFEGFADPFEYNKSKNGDPLIFNWGGGPVVVSSFGYDQHEELLDVDRPPDWFYRIDYLLAEHEVRKKAPFKPINVSVPHSKERLEALQNYLCMAENHKDYATKWGDGKEIVGLNNIGEVTFNWNSGDDKTVVQKLWWRLKDGKGLLEPFPLTKWIVSLSYIDANYPSFIDSKGKIKLPVKP